MREGLWRWPVLIIMMGVLLAGGTTYRIVSSSLNRITEAKIALERPLSSLPYKIMDWDGKDVPIPINIQRVAGADDFLSRLYINATDNTWVNLYVAYTARPRTMLGHRPQICYPASGWIYDSAERTELVTKANGHIQCLLHKFHRPGKGNEERFVLNYYVVNGRLTDDESVFSGIEWRTPNISGNAARYAAQIQISSFLEGPVRRAAQEMSDMLIGFFPGEDKSPEKSGVEGNAK